MLARAAGLIALFSAVSLLVLGWLKPQWLLGGLMLVGAYAQSVLQYPHAPPGCCCWCE
jgi:hypothetical protein